MVAPGQLAQLTDIPAKRQKRYRDAWKRVSWNETAFGLIINFQIG